MAVVLSELHRGYNNADQNNYVTSSLTPTGLRPVYVIVTSFGSGTSQVPTFAGWGETFTQRGTATNGARRLTAFSAPGVASPTTGTGAADFAGVGQTGCGIFVIEGTGIDVAGAAVGDGIEEIIISTGTSTTATVTITIGLSNGVWFVNLHASGIAYTAQTLDTPLGEANGTLPTMSHFSGWGIGDSSPVVTYGVSSSSWVACAMEFKEQAAAGITYPQLEGRMPRGVCRGVR